MKCKLLTITLFLVSLSFAQQRTCGVDEATERIYFNPILKQKQSELKQKFESELGKLNLNQNRNASNNNNFFIINLCSFDLCGEYT